MDKKELFIGLIIGLIVAFIGTYVFLISFTEFSSLKDLYIIKRQGILGKVITLGAILNMVVFFILLKMNKEMMARGIVLAMFILTILTLLI